MTTTVHIDKRARALTIFEDARPIATYPVVLGRNAGADKHVEGDCATPEGEFYVCAKNPRSRFLLSVCLSYPNAEDAARGLAAGLIDDEEYARIVAAIAERRMPPQGTRLGGEIYIHGYGEGTPTATRGCVALDNAAMREVYERVELGTAVLITA